MVDLKQFSRDADDWPPEPFRQLLDAFDRWGRTEIQRWPFKTSSPSSATLGDELAARIERSGLGGSDVRLIVILDELERLLPTPVDGEAAARRWIHASKHCVP